MTRMPQVSAKELERFLLQQGFERRRQSGSHLTMVHPVTKLRAVLPMHSGDLGRGIAHKILTGAGFSIDDYLRLR